MVKAEIHSNFLVITNRKNIDIDDISHIQIITKKGAIIECDAMNMSEIENYSINLSNSVRSVNDLIKLSDVETYRPHFDNVQYDFVKNVSIDISSNYITDEYLSSILDCWCRAEFCYIIDKLTSIKIGNNKLTKDGFLLLFDFIKEYCNKIEHLDVNINYVSQTEFNEIRSKVPTLICFQYKAY